MSETHGLLYHPNHVTSFTRSPKPRTSLLTCSNSCFLMNSFPQMVLCHCSAETTRRHFKSLRSFFSVWLWTSLQHAKADSFFFFIVETSSSTAPGEEFCPSSHLALAFFPYLDSSVSQGAVLGPLPFPPALYSLAIFYNLKFRIIVS